MEGLQSSPPDPSSNPIIITDLPRLPIPPPPSTSLPLPPKPTPRTSTTSFTSYVSSSSSTALSSPTTATSLSTNNHDEKPTHPISRFFSSWFKRLTPDGKMERFILFTVLLVSILYSAARMGPRLSEVVALEREGDETWINDLLSFLLEDIICEFSLILMLWGAILKRNSIQLLMLIILQFMYCLIYIMHFFQTLFNKRLTKSDKYKYCIDFGFAIAVSCLYMYLTLLIFKEFGWSSYISPNGTIAEQQAAKKRRVNHVFKSSLNICCYYLPLITNYYIGIKINLETVSMLVLSLLCYFTLPVVSWALSREKRFIVLTNLVFTSAVVVWMAFVILIPRVFILFATLNPAMLVSNLLNIIYLVFSFCLSVGFGYLSLRQMQMNKSRSVVHGLDKLYITPFRPNDAVGNAGSGGGGGGIHGKSVSIQDVKYEKQFLASRSVKTQEDV